MLCVAGITLEEVVFLSIVTPAKCIHSFHNLMLSSVSMARCPGVRHIGGVAMD